MLSPLRRSPAAVDAGAGVAADLSLGLLIRAVEEYAIYSLDPTGAVQTWNIGAQRIKGYTEREILGQHFSVFYLPEDRQADLPATELAHAIGHGQWSGEGWRVRRDGSRFWANVVITAIFGPDGQVTGFVKVTRDETGRKTAEESSRQLDLLRERERIAMELNDTTMRGIFSATLTLADALATTTDPRASELIADAIAALDRTVTQVRSTVTGLGLDRDTGPIAR
ncbi:PAS domain S-box protein [Nocardioides sp. LS1]|uniref:sensor histidine kinase n=1 Tax=Nocardioides sp. LS1 TaxID=1027620 RepID=UPI000F616B20|nr:PAS domain S-box protein [Nocardioides sp. LS1]